MSASLPPVSISAPTRTFCTFRIDDGLFGVDALLVQSINLPPLLTPLPHAPPCVCGVANLRGQVHLVLDLKQMLNLGPTTTGADTRLVVFKAVLGDPFGVLIDGVGDVAPLRADQIEDRRAAEAGASPDGLVCGVGKIDGQLITLLDARKFLPGVERLLARRAAGVSRLV